MPDLTDAQLDQLITDLGLTEPRRGHDLAPCGTQSAYTRHVKRGEPIDDACRQANTEAKRAKGTPTPRLRKPIAHGELRGAKQHRYRGEPLCEACHDAEAEYQRERAIARDGVERTPRKKAGPKPRVYLTEAEWQARAAARKAGAS